MKTTPLVAPEPTGGGNLAGRLPLPYGVFANGSAFFGSVKTGGRSRYLGAFACPREARAAVRSHQDATNSLPATQVTYSGM